VKSAELRRAFEPSHFSAVSLLVSAALSFSFYAIFGELRPPVSGETLERTNSPVSDT